MSKTGHRRLGFTLIELAIVLTIIGLIIGGVLVGRDLIFAAQINAQVAQISRLSEALNTFKEKYAALPGDMCQDTSKFGLSCGSTAGNARDNSTLDDMGGLNPIHNTVYEPIYFFGQLAQAKLIPPSYLTGTNSGGTACFTTTGPTAGYYKIALNSQFGMIAITWQGATWVWLGISDCGFSFLPGASPTAVMTPPQAAAIEAKIDDGVPSTGRALAFQTDTTTQLLNQMDTAAGKCVTTAAATSYNTTNGTLQCRMLIRLQ